MLANTSRSLVLALDPGLQCTGAAIFRYGLLSQVHACRAYEQADLALSAKKIAAEVNALFAPNERISGLVIELPKIYIGKVCADPRDIRDLAVLVGTMLGHIGANSSPETFLVEPRTWKGTIKKAIHHARIKAQLKENERAIALAAEDRFGARAHNVLDAVGLGLYILGR
jgi:hypothetical protein